MKTTLVMFVLAMAAGLGACAAPEEPTSTPADEPPTEAPHVTVDEDTTAPAYGSVYASNCTCLACTKYCQVDWKTYKDGTCC